jgi:hypothetical protein
MFPSLRFHCLRKNYVNAAYVNAALKLLEKRPLDRLISMLFNQGVPEAVISRALFSNGQLENTESIKLPQWVETGLLRRTVSGRYLRVLRQFYSSVRRSQVRMFHVLSESFPTVDR